MKKSNQLILLIGITTLLFTSCSNFEKVMREPNTRLELNKSDFTLSDQVMAEARTVKILGIDWGRLFNASEGVIEKDGFSVINFASVPVIGYFIYDRTANYALYELMQNNPGYDVVFYPQYETKISRPIGIGFIYKKTVVKTTARLGKLNK